MKRVIIKTTEGMTLEGLTEVQQDAIRSVFAQWVIPMPGTKVYNSHILIDAVVQDNFDPSVIVPLNLPFEVIGLWQWDGVNDLVELQALDTSFINYLPDICTYNPDTMEVVTTTSPVLHECHRWSGWPGVTI